MIAVDLRSDTVTRPTPEMYEAMRTAALGDDVLGDDPTVRELEELGAAMLGKEAGVFVPSGTMGNQIALATHCRPGDAILLDEDAHILYYEVGAPAVIARAVTCTMSAPRGILDPDEVRRRLLQRTIHTPGTALVCIENTHNRAGGTVTPADVMHALGEVAHLHGAKLHMDGARVFNAAVALGVDVKELAAPCDSVSFCLSKGLRSPVGSLLVGSQTFIDEARFWRKRLGGGMRQAGILAACGIVSLTTMVARLAEDHRRARTLAEALATVPGLSVDLGRVQTNIVLIQTDRPSSAWHQALLGEGIGLVPFGPHTLRAVLHADVDDDGVEQAVAAFKRLVASS
ncbi:MAG: threonine aldolase family protein [Fimbriimonadaceae bacterium]